MRLDKYLSFCLVKPRQEVKKIIKSGKVTVNGEIVKKDDYKLDEEKDIVYISNQLIEYNKYTYLMLHKPSGYVTSTKDDAPTVMELLPNEFKNLFPVGRLDKDTEGLLLFTNDGMLIHYLTSPKKQVTKTYYVELLKEIKEEIIPLFKDGVTLDDGYVTLPSALEIIDSKKVLLTITEGKYHQVKRMFLSVNNKVTYLKRISFGPIMLGELEYNTFRKLTTDEIEQLKKATK